MSLLWFTPYLWVSGSLQVYYDLSLSLRPCQSSSLLDVVDQYSSRLEKISTSLSSTQWAVESIARAYLIFTKQWMEFHGKYFSWQK